MSDLLFSDPPRRVAFFVHGTPEPKGSFMAILVKGRPTPIPDNSKSKGWERAVKLVAARVCKEHDWLPFDRPCRVDMVFYMPRPAKPRFSRPATKPDWDKLVRSTGDALTGIAYVDDARVVEARVRLEYEMKDAPCGVGITVEEVLT